ncbi:MAG TPA: HNH endonuclease signature motif containing protein [Spirochaetia bacterium]|nr:HNH endonuclease signature motif containing protein [Spirochaetia bacterium]
MSAGKKIEWTDAMINFLIDNYRTLSNKQLADGLGLKLTSVRMKLYEMGYKRIDMEYWTPEQEQFLKDNFEQIGDVEMSELFEKKWPKIKKWTKTHIGKKRKYLDLFRTTEQIKAINERNIKMGRFSECAVKRWKKDIASPEGTIKIWMVSKYPAKFIKVNNKYTPYAPWLYKKIFGDIPDGMVVSFKDGNNLNVVEENLMLITRSESGKRMTEKAVISLSDRYISGLLAHKDFELKKQLLANPEILHVKRLQLQLNRIINATEKSSNDTA